MTSTVQKIGINIGGSSTDPISFSTLRSTFFQSDPDISVTGTATVKASDLIRTTVLPESSDTNGQTNPTCPFDGSKNGVPNATENASIITTSSAGSNWKVSHFQQSVKWYNINQSGTDENYDIDAQSWNSNLTKNVVKRWRVNGTVGSNSSSTAAVFSDSAYNLRIEVSGNIYGYGGKGGGTSGAPAISGESGGDALQVSSSTGKVVIDVKSTGKIFGGGGGGEKGISGANGTGGTCYEYYYINQCSVGAPSCAGGWTQISSGWGCCEWNRGCAVARWTRTCEKTTPTSGGTGGAGGNGGPGRGYNNQTGSLSGVAGSAGTAGGGCGATDGGNGETGASGGEWANSGGNTSNSGEGGGAGKAVFGTGYAIIGSTSSDNIKGTIN